VWCIFNHTVQQAAQYWQFDLSAHEECKFWDLESWMKNAPMRTVALLTSDAIVAALDRLDRIL